MKAALVAIWLCPALAVVWSLEAAGEVLRAGLAKIDITPQKPVTLSGYESRKDLSQGVHDPLSARVVALDQGGKRLVLISTDIIGFYGGTSDAIRSAIMKECQLQPEELFLTAIHTHSAPTPVLDASKGHSNNVEYTKWLETQLSRAAREALAGLSPVKLGFASGSSPVGCNRREVTRDDSGKPAIVLGRNPDIPIDREVQVLRLARAGNDETVALCFAYATHSTSLGPRNYILSGDVHGLAEQFVEKHFGAGVIAPAFAGASGNIDPWYRVLPEFNTTNGWIPEPVLLGTLLGEEIVHVSQRTMKLEAGGPIASVFKTIQLPGKPRGELQTTDNCPPSPLNLTVGRIGEIAFVGFGGEVFNEIGKAVKSASPFACTVVMTHCNGTAGYLPISSAYPEGGYEIKTSPFAPAAADMVVQEVLNMLRELKSQGQS